MNLNNANNMQKMFSLFAIGDRLDGIVYAIISGVAKLKFDGNTFGIIAKEDMQYYSKIGIDLSVGKKINVVVDKTENGYPICKLTPNFISSWPRYGQCKMLGTQGAVIRLIPQPDKYAFYPFNGEPTIKVDDYVVCEGITDKGDSYLVQNIDVIDQEIYQAKESELECTKTMDFVKIKHYLLDPKFQAPQSWGEEKIAETIKRGSAKVTVNGMYRLGMCYLGSMETPYSVLLNDRQKAKITERNGYDPKIGQEVIVRVTRIYPSNGYIEVEIECVPDQDYIRNFKMLQPSSQRDRYVVKNGFTFNERDREVYASGIHRGSEKMFEQYWLGYLYEVPIKDGSPLFENRRVGRIKTIVEGKHPPYKEGSTVYCRLKYIQHTEDSAVLTVMVVYSE